MRYLTLMVVISLWALAGCGCSSSWGTGAPSSDGPLPADSAPGFPGNFCTGGPAVMLNGAKQQVTDLRGFGHPQMSCCNELGLVHFRLPPRGGKIPFLQLTESNDCARWAST